MHKQTLNNSDKFFKYNKVIILLCYLQAHRPTLIHPAVSKY